MFFKKSNKRYNILDCTIVMRNIFALKKSLLCLGIITITFIVSNSSQNHDGLQFNEDKFITTLSKVFNIGSIVVVSKKLRDTRSWLKSNSNYLTIRHISDSISLKEAQLFKENLAFTLDFDDNATSIFEDLLTSSKSYLYAVSSTWFILGANHKINSLRKILQDHIRVNQRIFFVDTEFGHVTEAYKVVDHKVSNSLGLLTYADGIVEYIPIENRNWLQRRSDLMGQGLHGLTNHQPPYLAIPYYKSFLNSNKSVTITHKGSKFTDITNEIIFGSFKDVINYLESNLNFTTRFFVSQVEYSNTFGSKINGTWNGVIGHIAEGEADFIATSLTQTDKRFEVLKFAQPIAAETFALYVPYEGYDEREWVAFLYPLTANLWILLILNTFLTLLTFKALELYYFGKKLYLQKVNLVGDFWMLFTSYFGKAPGKKFSSEQEAIRVLLLIVYLVGNLVFMSYKASLTAALSVQKLYLPFESIDELLDSDIKVISPNTVHEYLANFYNLEAREGTSELARVYFEKILKYPEGAFLNSFTSSLKHLITMDERSTFLFVKEMMPFLGDDVCKTTIAHEFSFPAKVSLAFPKNSPYHEIFNYGLLKTMESGYLETTLRKYFEDSNNCINNGDSDHDTDKSLGLVKLSSLFVIMAAGIVLSALTLALETVSITLNKMSGQSASNIETRKVHTIDEVGFSDDEFDLLMQKWGILVNQESFRAEMKELLQKKS